MRKVFVASPFRSSNPREMTEYRLYARRAMLHCFDQGEAPFVPQLLYTMILDDNIEEERKRGVNAASEFLVLCDVLAVYMDYGISGGMRDEINHARQAKIPIMYREIGKISKMDTSESSAP